MIGLKRLLARAAGGISRAAASPAARTLALFAAAALLAALAPRDALAWSPEDTVSTLLKFLKLVIILAAGVLCVKLVLHSQLVPAVIVIFIAGIVYVCLDPNVIEAIGRGIKDYLGFGGGSGGGGSGS